MEGKSRLFALLGRDHQRLAELAYKEGDRKRALDLYAKAGNLAEAVRVAVELGDERRAVEMTLRAVFGEVPEGYGEATAVEAGELLATGGHHKEAIPLLEMGQAWRRAADCCLKLQQLARAARHYERARAWSEAAIYYRRANRDDDALRVLEHEVKRLRQEVRVRPALEGSLRHVEVERAELLAKQGKRAEAAASLDATAAETPTAARLLEQGGRHREALEVWLTIGQPQEALRLLPKIQGLEPRLAAQVHLRSGNPAFAGAIFAASGLTREAAEAFEAAKEWAKAAAQWEALRDLQRAGEAFLRAQRFADAGQCFLAGDNALLAAECFVKAGYTVRAGEAYARGGRPVEAALKLLEGRERGRALDTLRAVSPLAPEGERAALLLVSLLLEEGRAEEARERLDRLSPLPAEPEKAGRVVLERLYWSGRVQEALGRAQEAASVYRKVAAIDGAHRDNVERLRRLDSAADATVATPTRPEGPPPIAADAFAPGAVLPPGTVLAGRYRIVAELGHGGMGRVYKAFDREVREEVAIKTLLGGAGDDVQEEERLLREVQICRRITHPNVVRVFDLGRFAGGIFITMELVTGEPLDTVLRREGALPLGRARALLGEIVAGLAEAHALQVVHRDLKPGNVMVTPGRLKILDFGIARMAGFDARLTQTGFTVGSPHYMSPEQLQGREVDGRSDLYSLGVIAFRMLTGREPFAGTSPVTLAVEHLHTPAPDPRGCREDVPAPWAAFLARLLAKTPDQRYPSAPAVAEALAALPV